MSSPGDLFGTQDFERYLDVVVARYELVASNLANIDTPGYRTRDIRFQEELQRAMSEGGQEPTTPLTYEVPGLIERPDGNNVSLDRESMLLAQLQLQYRLGTTLLKGEFHDIQSAINEGK